MSLGREPISIQRPKQRKTNRAHFFDSVSPGPSNEVLDEHGLVNTILKYGSDGTQFLVIVGRKKN